MPNCLEIRKTGMKSDRLFRPACVLALAGALSACAPVFLGGVVVGTSVVATDRRSSGAQLEDETIEVRAASRIQEHVGQRVHVDVTSYNRQVLLTGEVGSLQDKQLIEQIVARVDNVRAVINELEVMGNSATMQRSSDALITGRVKTNLLDARDLTANAFKVVTERGTTYLLGRVTRREADRATEVTRNTPGVQKVVRVLEIISEEELQGAQPLKPAANTGMATR
jgi:osmotically-inducible protein OsmY